LHQAHLSNRSRSDPADPLRPEQLPSVSVHHAYRTCQREQMLVTQVHPVQR